MKYTFNTEKINGVINLDILFEVDKLKFCWELVNVKSYTHKFLKIVDAMNRQISCRFNNFLDDYKTNFWNVYLNGKYFVLGIVMKQYKQAMKFEYSFTYAQIYPVIKHILKTIKIDSINIRKQQMVSHNDRILNINRGFLLQMYKNEIIKCYKNQLKIESKISSKEKDKYGLLETINKKYRG